MKLVDPKTNPNRLRQVPRYLPSKRIAIPSFRFNRQKPVLKTSNFFTSPLRRSHAAVQRHFAHATGQCPNPCPYANLRRRQSVQKRNPEQIARNDDRIRAQMFLCMTKVEGVLKNRGILVQNADASAGSFKTRTDAGQLTRSSMTRLISESAANIARWN